MSGESPWLIVGLGNPGARYAGNRHNAGAMVTEVLAGRIGGRWKSHRGRADVVEGRLGVGEGEGNRIEGIRVVLIRPRSFMNDSGGPVAALRDFFKPPIERIVAVHDELDLPFGGLRLKLGGGDNGHNGLRSMRSSLGSGEFHRVRIGVGRPPGRQDPADFVLRDYSATERKELPLQLELAADAIDLLLRDGLDRAQNQFNT